MIAGATPGQAPRLGVNLSRRVGRRRPRAAVDDRARARQRRGRSVQPDLRDHRDRGDREHDRGDAVRHGPDGLGCSLALDDFGTGFGSFYYLKHLPVRYVKLDGEFIQNLPRNQVDEHMVRAIVGVAHGIGHQDRRRVRRRRRDDRDAPRARRRLRPGLPHRQARAGARAARGLGTHRRGRRRARPVRQVGQMIGLAIALVAE